MKDSHNYPAASKCCAVLKPSWNSPICMQISPIAQVALLQTEMNSGFRFVPRIGMNSATKQQNIYVQ